MRQRLMVVLWVVFFFIGAGASTRAWADCYPQYDICGTVASNNPNFPLNPGIFDVQQDQELYVKWTTWWTGALKFELCTGLGCTEVTPLYRSQGGATIKIPHCHWPNGVAGTGSTYNVRVSKVGSAGASGTSNAFRIVPGPWVCLWRADVDKGAVDQGQNLGFNWYSQQQTHFRLALEVATSNGWAQMDMRKWGGGSDGRFWDSDGGWQGVGWAVPRDLPPVSYRAKVTVSNSSYSESGYIYNPPFFTVRGIPNVSDVTAAPVELTRGVTTQVITWRSLSQTHYEITRCVNSYCNVVVPRTQSADTRSYSWTVENYATAGRYQTTVRVWAAVEGGNSVEGQSNPSWLRENYVSFGAASAQSSETAGTVSVPVRLTTADSDPTLSPVTVQVSPAGSATPSWDNCGSGDYVLLNSSVTFAAGTASGTTGNVPIRLCDDEIHENPETVSLQLTSPSQAVLRDPTAATLTILDDDRFYVSVDDRAVKEGTGAAAGFRVWLNEARTDARIVVRYTTVDGSARAGQDYTATSGELVFERGQTMRSVTVPILFDTVAEGQETFTLRLTSATKAIIDRGTATGSISDPPTPAPAAMYRAYNLGTDYHFFTTSLGEFCSVVGANYDNPNPTHGYRNESKPVPFRVLNASDSGATAVYRLYNAVNGRHYYTASAGERDVLTNVHAWVFETVEGYVYPLSAPPPLGTVELFHMYNVNSGTHLFTANPGEKDHLLATFPGIWQQHGSLGYVFPTDGTNAQCPQ